MSVFGITAEYNPFHNGHKYHVDETRRSADDAVVAVMSGNFVQRGECALMPQRARVKSALECGVDLVVSLPLPAAVSGAQCFAFSAVFILDALGVVDKISFGSESGDLQLLSAAAGALADKKLDGVIRDELKSGKTYAKARQAAVEQLYGKTVASVISTPNDVLGVEYIRALKKLSSKMGAAVIKREGVAHDGISQCKYKSASQIRSEIYSGVAITQGVPEASMRIINEYMRLGKAPPDKMKFEAAAMSVLRRMTADDFKRLPDISEGLENKLYQSVRSASSLEGILDNAKSKRYTHSRLRRILLSAYLGITREYAAILPPYIRVLGFNEKGQQLLSEIAKKAKLPMITKPSQTETLSDYAKRLYKLECAATDLYSLTLPIPDECGREMTDGIIKIQR